MNSNIVLAIDEKAWPWSARMSKKASWKNLIKLDCWEIREPAVAHAERGLWQYHVIREN